MKLDAGNAVVTKLTCRFLSFVSAVFMIMAGFLIPAVQAGAPYGDPNQPYDKLPGILESYHVNWATPLPGGKLKVLFFIPYFNSREVVELRQRLDLDYTVIMTGGKSAWAQGYVEGGSASPIENAENLVDRIARERLDLQKTYDAIIIGKVSWEVIPKEFRDLIMRHVQRGTALVYVSANRSGAGWNADNPEATTADPQYASMFGRNLMPEEGKAIFATLPFDLIPLKTVADAAEFAKLSPPPQAAPNVPAQQAVSIRVSEEGKGRIVVLDYHDKGGKWQSFNSLTPSVDYDQVMYDYVYALLAKCVLYGVSGEPKVKAAVTFASPVVPPAVVPTNLWDKKKPTVVLDRDGLATAKLQLTVAAASDVTAKLTLDLSIRDSRGATMKNEQSSLGVIAGKTESRTLPLPTLPRGDYTIDLRVLNEKGAVFDFASTSFRVDSPFQVAKIETDKALYEKGEKIQGKVFFAQALAGNQTAGVTAIDTWDRIVNRAAVMLSADRLSGVFSIPVDLPLSRL